MTSLADPTSAPELATAPPGVPASSPGVAEPSAIGATARPARTVQPGPAATPALPVLLAQAKVLADVPLDAAAGALADHLALVLSCERVAIGLRRRGRVALVTVSGANDWRQRQPLAGALRDAMEEAIEQDAAVLQVGTHAFEPVDASSAGRPVGTAAGLCAVPISAAGRPLGALAFERRAGFDALTMQAVRDAAMFVGPMLAWRAAAERQGWRRMLGQPQGTTALAAHAGGLVLTAAIGLGVGLWPVAHRVSGPARIEGAAQQVVAAPADGFLGEVLVRPGAVVKAGDPLLQMQTRDLVAERERWAAEIGQLDKQYREAMAGDQAGPMVAARARLEQAQAALALADAQLERATLRAPVAGEVIAGDLMQQVGQPVQRGQSLMTLAGGQGRRVVVEVDERDVAGLRLGQSAQVLFAGLERSPVHFTVQRIAPVATQAEGRNVFEVEGTPQAPDGLDPQALRHGLAGVGRIEVGERGLAALWWGRLTGSLRAWSWRWLG